MERKAEASRVAGSRTVITKQRASSVELSCGGNLLRACALAQSSSVQRGAKPGRRRKCLCVTSRYGMSSELGLSHLEPLAERLLALRRARVFGRFAIE